MDPKYHYQCNVLEVLDKGWDLMVAHPPCTYLTNAAAVRLKVDGVIQEERWRKAQEAKQFFMTLYNADIPHIAIENPVPSKIHELPKYTQIIEPYMFGEPWKKRTCLWLKGIDPLTPTNIVKPEGLWVGSTSSRRDKKIHSKYKLSSSRSQKIRSKTFQGIADAMAKQWG